MPPLGGPYWNTAITKCCGNIPIKTRWWKKSEDMFTHLMNVIVRDGQTDSTRHVISPSFVKISWWLWEMLLNVVHPIFRSGEENGSDPESISGTGAQLKVNQFFRLVGPIITPVYLSELVQTRAPPRALRSSDARHSSHTHRTGPSHFFCCCSIHLELSTCWHSTVWKHSHFQTPLENPSVKTHLVLCCIKRLCIFGPKGAIQIRYYYYYSMKSAHYFFSLLLVSVSTVSWTITGQPRNSVFIRRV